MRIYIRSQQRTKFRLWLPSGPIVIRIFLRLLKIEGVKFNKQQRDRIYQEIKQLKKAKVPVLELDIQEKNGDRVWMKI